MAWRRGGLIRPVQVAVIPEAAYEEEEPPDRTLSGGQGARAHPCWETLPSRGKPRLPRWAVVRPEREGRAGE